MSVVPAPIDVTYKPPKYQAIEVQRVHPLIFNAYEALFALLLINAGLAWLLDPADRASTAIGRVLHPFDLLWNVMFVAGGILILAGLIISKARLQLLGSWLFAGSTFMVVVAAILVGPREPQTPYIYAAACLAASARIYVLSRGLSATQPKPSPELQVADAAEVRHLSDRARDLSDQARTRSDTLRHESDRQRDADDEARQ